MHNTGFLALLLTAAVTLSACKVKSTSELKNFDNPDSTFTKTGSVERFSPLMDDIISAGAMPEIIAEGFEWTEGPLWLPEQDILLFSDIPANAVYQWSEKEGSTLYLQPAGYTDTISRVGETGSNGLLLNKKGQLILCQHGDRRMARMNSPVNNPVPDFVTLVDRWQGKRLNSPNDAVYNSHGDLYFTDPPYGMEHWFEDPKRELNFTGVYKLTAEGVLVLLTDKMTAPNGIGLSPDESRLYVSNSGADDQAVWMEFRILSDGSLDKGSIFRKPSKEKMLEKGAPDGLKVRADGIIFATGPGGVWIFSPRGEHLGTIKTGQATSNCAFGSDGRYLYMTADMYVMRIRLK